jgi:hypothetical protein
VFDVRYFMFCWELATRQNDANRTSNLTYADVPDSDPLLLCLQSAVYLITNSLISSRHKDAIPLWDKDLMGMCAPSPSLLS